MKPGWQASLERAGGWIQYAARDLEGPLPDALAGVRALVLPWGYDIPSEALLRLPRLELVAGLGTGIWDYIDVPACTARGVCVATVRDHATPAVAEHTLALLLAVARDVTGGDRSVRSGGWRTAAQRPRELEGSTLGVIGLGAIGERVAALGVALGMRTIGWTPNPGRRPRSVCLVDLPTLLSSSDVISLHAAWRGGPPLIGRDELGLLKQGAILINTARGQLIDEGALREALVSGRLAGAGLDVYAQEPPRADHPLLTAPHVVLSPHHGADTASAERRAIEAALENVLAFYEGRARNVINPEAAAADGAFAAAQEVPTT